MTVSRRVALALLVMGAGAAQAQQKTVITFAGATFAEAGRGDKLRAWVEEFNKSQDKIEVQPVTIPFSTFANTVFTQMGGGGGPDLVRLDQTDYYAAVEANRLLPMDDLVKPGLKWSAPDKFLKVGDKRFGIPFEISNYVLIVNGALVPNPPKDFDAFVEAAKAATKEGNYGFAFRATMAERAGFWQDVCNYVYGFGGRWSDDAGNLTLNSPKVIEGVAAYKRMYDAGAIPKGADAATYRRMFWEGKLGMEIDNGGVATIFYTQSPTMKLMAAPSPFPTKAQGLILAPLAVNANTKSKEAVKTFLGWMLEPEHQASLQQLLGASNVATVVPRPEADLKERPWLAVFDAQTENSVPQLVTGYENKTPEIQQIVLEAVLRVLQAGQDPKRAMDDAQRLATSRVARK